MSMEDTITRINELARKKKMIGLNEAELIEQGELRRVYLNAIKSSLKSQLDSIEIVEDDQSQK